MITHTPFPRRWLLTKRELIWPSQPKGLVFPQKHPLTYPYVAKKMTMVEREAYNGFPTSLRLEDKPNGWLVAYIIIYIFGPVILFILRKNRDLFFMPNKKLWSSNWISAYTIDLDFECVVSCWKRLEISQVNMLVNEPKMPVLGFEIKFYTDKNDIF